jgi:sRNA-binding carbon storage regulator CsrA
MGLVLDRKSGQKVRIGNVVVSVDRRCRLHIQAPREIPIVREELELERSHDRTERKCQVGERWTD